MLDSEGVLGEEVDFRGRREVEDAGLFIRCESVTSG
jgi:hypothetical protein